MEHAQEKVSRMEGGKGAMTIRIVQLQKQVQELEEQLELSQKAGNLAGHRKMPCCSFGFDSICSFMKLQRLLAAGFVSGSPLESWRGK